MPTYYMSGTILSSGDNSYPELQFMTSLSLHSTGGGRQIDMMSYINANGATEKNIEGSRE